MTHLATSTFLGQPPAEWSAVAAFGSLLTAISVAIATYLLSGARPKVKVRLAAIDSTAVLHSMSVWLFKRRNRFPSDAFECVEVTVENRGRSPLTIDHPVFEIRYWPWRPQFWWRLLTFRKSTIGTWPVRWDGYETEGSARLEAGGRLRFLLPVDPLLRNPYVKAKKVKGTEKPKVVNNRRDWDYARMRVVTAGKRDKIARWRRVPVSPRHVQFSGEAETFRQVTTRWLIHDTLVQVKSKAKPKEREATLIDTGMLANHLVNLYDSDEQFTLEAASKVFKDRFGGSGMRAFRLGTRLIEAGFVTEEDFYSKAE